jgi:hypothetical protein
MGPLHKDLIGLHTQMNMYSSTGVGCTKPE